MGKSENVFYPTETIAREDFIIVLAKALKLDTLQPPTAPTFFDIPQSHYAFLYVEAAVRAGLVVEQKEGKFGAGQRLSRQELAVMLVRAAELSGLQPVAPAVQLDQSQIATDAQDAVVKAYNLGLINSNKDGTFKPTAEADRQTVACAVAKLLARMYEQEVCAVGDSTAMTGTNMGTGNLRVVQAGKNVKYKSSAAAKHAPALIKPIADLGMTAGGDSVTVSLAGVFSDQETDSFYYTATASGTGKLVIRQQGSSLVLTAHGEGTAVVRVVASDGEGSTATTSFQVKIEADHELYHPQYMINPFSTQILTVGEPPVMIDASGAFADEDGDMLSCAVSSSDPVKLQAAVRGTQIVLVPLAAGEAKVRVNVQDGRGAEIAVSFMVKIKEESVKESNPPLVKQLIPNQTLVAGSIGAMIELADVFGDEEADTFFFSAQASSSDVTMVTVDRSRLFLFPSGQGTATITVTAEDDNDGAASTSFQVTVEAMSVSVPLVNHSPAV